MKIIEFLSPGYQVHKELNPVLWTENQEIRPEIGKKLLAIARHFREFVKLDFPIVDLVITGGMTGKYYTDKSDIDLHLITDYEKIECDQETAELFDTKRLLYKEKFDIRIYDIPVELYVEDLKQPAKGGSYSLKTNQWVRSSTEPKQEIDDPAVAKMAIKISKLIRQVIHSGDLVKAKSLQKAIWQTRQTGLSKHGEFGVANLAFKSLRNSGQLAKLLDHIRKLESKSLGLNQ